MSLQAELGLALSPLFQGKAHRVAQLHHIKRFADEVKGAKFHSPLRELQGIRTGKHNDFTVRAKRFDLAQYLDAVDFRHENVEENDLGFFLLRLRNRGVRGSRLKQAVVFIKDHLQGFTDAHLVIDNQQRRSIHIAVSRRRFAQVRILLLLSHYLTLPARGAIFRGR